MYTEEEHKERARQRARLYYSFNYEKERERKRLEYHATNNIDPRVREVAGIRFRSLVDFFWLNKNRHGPQFTGICMTNRGVRFHRIRDFKQCNFNIIILELHKARA